MNTTRKAPLFLRLCSYFFVFMGIISLCTLAIVLTNPTVADKISISFISNSVTYSDHPFIFVGISSLFIVAAIVGLAIIFRKRYAYDLGVFYSVSAYVFLGTLTIIGIGVVGGISSALSILLVVFGGFFTYLIRNRDEWRKC